MGKAAGGKRELEMTAIAGALSRIGDINKPPLGDALDAIRIRGDRIAALEAENERLRTALKMFVMGDGCVANCFRMGSGSHSPGCAATRAALAKPALDTPPT